MSEVQRTLFDTQPQPWEDDDQAEQLVATVCFPKGPQQEFDYLVPDPLRETVQPGCRVRAPLGRGNRLVLGYCVRMENRPVGPRRLKPLEELIDPRSLLSPAMLRLTAWIAQHYLCSLAQVLEAVLPAGVRGRAGTRMTTLLSLDPESAGRLATIDLPEKQAAVLKALARAGEPLTPAQLALAAKCTQAPIAALRRKGLLRSRTGRAAIRPPLEPPAASQKHLALNPHQRAALDAILAALNSRQHRTILIHGVTGSGKTEVYIQAKIS